MNEPISYIQLVGVHTINIKFATQEWYFGDHFGLQPP